MLRASSTAFAPAAPPAAAPERIVIAWTRNRIEEIVAIVVINVPYSIRRPRRTHGRKCVAHIIVVDAFDCSALAPALLNTSWVAHVRARIRFLTHSRHVGIGTVVVDVAATILEAAAPGARSIRAHGWSRHSIICHLEKNPTKSRFIVAEEFAARPQV